VPSSWDAKIKLQKKVRVAFEWVWACLICFQLVKHTQILESFLV